MKHIFYFIAILFIIYELIWIISPREQAEKFIKLKSESKKNEGKGFDEWTDEYKSLLFRYALVGLFMMLWMLSGLLTYNWVAFMLFIGFNLMIIMPLSKLFNYNLGYIVLHWINSVIGLLFGVFIILNSYHLKIDLYSWLLSLF